MPQVTAKVYMAGATNAKAKVLAGTTNAKAKVLAGATNAKAKVYMPHRTSKADGCQFAGSYHCFWKQRFGIDERTEQLAEIPLDSTLQMRSPKAHATGHPNKYFPRGYPHRLNNSSLGMSSVMEDDSLQGTPLPQKRSRSTPRSTRSGEIVYGVQRTPDDHELTSFHFSSLEDNKWVPRVRRTRPVPWEHPPEHLKRYQHLYPCDPVVPVDPAIVASVSLVAAAVATPRKIATRRENGARVQTPFPHDLRRGSPCPSRCGAQSPRCFSRTGAELGTRSPSRGASNACGGPRSPSRIAAEGESRKTPTPWVNKLGDGRNLPPSHVPVDEGIEIELFAASASDEAQ